MSFSFNFEVPDAQEETTNSCGRSDPDYKHVIKPVAPFEEILPRPEQESLHENVEKSVLDLTSTKVQFLVGGQMERLLRGDLLEATEENLDIVPSVYEGGMKVWECSIDLAEYVENQLSIDSDTRVLELGCGAGLPGLVACLKGASVDFQDYNKEVLQLVTIPNAFANIGSRVKKRCRFFAGDWSALADHVKSEHAGCKMQEFGLVNCYRVDDPFRTFVDMLNALAFLPMDVVEDGVRQLCSTMPSVANGLAKYFDSN